MNKFSDKIFTSADQEVVEYQGEPVNWRVSAYAVVMQQDKLLIIKNKQEKLFDLPGGGIDLGETIEEALHREVMEEAGATIEIGKLIFIKEGFFKHANGSYYQTIQLFYLAKLTKQLASPSDETTELVKLVPIVELDKYPLPKAASQAINSVRK